MHRRDGGMKEGGGGKVESRPFAPPFILRATNQLRATPRAPDAFVFLETVRRRASQFCNNINMHKSSMTTMIR